MPLSIPGDNGEAPLARPGHALAKRMRLAEGHRARQRDSRDRITGLRLAATTVRAIPTRARLLNGAGDTHVISTVRRV